MLVLCNYDACYHSFHNFLYWHAILLKSTFLYLSRVNYVFYWCLTFCKVKQLEINHFPWFYFDFRGWLKEEIRRREWWMNQSQLLGVDLILFWIHHLFLFNFIFQHKKIKKFVIQWRKFEAKRSSRNEVMKLWRLIIFFGIFMIFQEFLELKNCKKYLCALDPRGADVARRGQVTTPWELTRNNASPRGCLRGAEDRSGQVFWAHEYRGPM